MRFVNHGATCSSSSRDRGATSGSEVAITTHAHVANTAAAETADEWQYVPSAGRDAQTWYNNLKKRSRAANEGTVLLPAAAEGDASPHVSSGCHPSAGASRGSGEEGAASDPANGSGGGFLPLEVEGAGCKLVCDTRLAPTYYMAPDQGYVQYRHDTLLLRPYTVGAGKNCLLEGMMAATGLGIGALKVNAAALDAFMAKVAFNPEHGPSMGVLDNALMEAKSPFRLPLLKELNANHKWTLLLNRTEGVYIVLALVRYTEGPDKGKKGGRFVVYDAWRDLLIIGPGHGVLRVEPRRTRRPRAPSCSSTARSSHQTVRVQACRRRQARERDRLQHTGALHRGRPAGQACESVSRATSAEPCCPGELRGSNARTFSYRLTTDRTLKCKKGGGARRHL